MGVAKGEAMTRDLDPERIASTLIQEYGFEAAATYAVDRIAELHEEGNLYGLSYWREIRKAIADLTNETDHAGEPDNDR